MLLQTDRLDIYENSGLSSANLHFAFKGKFTTESSEAGCKAWTSHFQKKPQQQFTIIWDCTQMTGFEIDARKQWYVGLTETKQQIREIIVVSDNLMIRASARVMCGFFGIKGKFVRTLDEALQENPMT